MMISFVFAVAMQRYLFMFYYCFYLAIKWVVQGFQLAPID